MSRKARRSLGLERGRVEGRVGGEGDAVAGVQSRRAVLQDEVEHGAMRHRHALGLAGGAGGVHHVGRRERMGDHLLQGRWRIERQLIRIQAKQLRNV